MLTKDHHRLSLLVKITKMFPLLSILLLPSDVNSWARLKNCGLVIFLLVGVETKPNAQLSLANSSRGCSTRNVENAIFNRPVLCESDLLVNSEKGQFHCYVLFLPSFLFFQTKDTRNLRIAVVDWSFSLQRNDKSSFKLIFVCIFCILSKLSLSKFHWECQYLRVIEIVS